MKIPELQKRLRAEKIDAAVFMGNDPHFRYLAEVNENPEYGWLIVHARRGPVIYIPGFEAPRFRKMTSIAVKEPKEGMFRGVKTLGIVNEYFTIANSKWKPVKGIKRKDISKIMLELRRVKTAKELRIIQEACKLTDEIFEKTFRRFKTFKREQDAKIFMENLARETGGTSFPTIVGSGKNGALPHYQGNEKLRKGFCVIDYGVFYKGYCSDVTRTIYLGKPSKKEKEMYDAVRRAQQIGIDAVRAGVEAASVDAAVRYDLGKLNKYFIHGLGHQVGVDVHEGSDISLSRNSKGTLEKNMVVTVEPGLYFRGKYGIRIEDDVVVQDGPAKVLSKATKNLVIVR